MQYLKKDPMPLECINCREPECDVCDIGSELWYIPHDLELRLQIRGLTKALNRIKKNSNSDWIEARIKELESQLLPFSDIQVEAIEHKQHMTKDIFDQCLKICIESDDKEMQYALAKYFPEYIE